MAYVLVYSQNFSEGDSTFSQTGFYSRDPAESPAETASGADPKYPDARQAEGVQVNASGGPSGEKTVDLWSGYTGPFQGYSQVGIWFNVPDYTNRVAGLTCHRGAAEVWYKPNADSLADNTFCPLFYLESNEIQRQRLTAYLSGGTWYLRYQVSQTFGTTTHDPIHTFGTTAAITDDPFLLRLEWNDGTLACAPDQYVRVLVNGTQVLELVEGSPDFLDLHASVANIGGYKLGFAGLWGEATNVRIYADDDCDAEPEPETVPIIDNATPCPCPSTPGPASVPDPVGVLQPPTYVCEGGGTVEAVADLDGLGGCWAAGMAA